MRFVLGLLGLLAIALAIVSFIILGGSDQAFQTAARQARDDIRPITSELTSAVGVHDLDRVEKAGNQLSERASHWDKTLNSMQISDEMGRAKSYWSSALEGLQKSGDAYARAARQERAGQEREAADSWNFAEEYYIGASDDMGHAFAALSPKSAT